jgi:glycosyltransferase involved in cell wall biosynthesis
MKTDFTDNPGSVFRSPIRERVSSISVILPAHNEEGNITAAVSHAIEVVEKLPFNDYEIIIIDDGSSDRTSELVHSIRAECRHISLIRHERNLGYGGSLKSGLRAARGDLVFFTDADLQFDINELPDFIENLKGCDMVIGYRARRSEKFIRRFNAFGWKMLIRILFGLKVRDIDCAFKLFRRRVLDNIPIDSIGAFINSEILIRARDLGFTIKEMPVTHFPRRVGKPSGARPKTIIKAFKELFKLYGQLKRKKTRLKQEHAYSS